MVSHLVLLTPRPDLAETDRERLITAFERAVQAIPTVRGARVGRRIVHGAGYEAQMPDTGYLVMLEFEDVSGLESYLRHPAHDELAARFGESLAGALIYDFEDVEFESLRELR
jgi:hypothetical protein